MRVIPRRERYNYVDRPRLLTCAEEKSRDNGSPTRASALHTVYHPSTGHVLQIAAPQMKLLHPSAQAARSWHRSPPHGVPDTGKSQSAARNRKSHQETTMSCPPRDVYEVQTKYLVNIDEEPSNTVSKHHAQLLARKLVTYQRL